MDAIQKGILTLIRSAVTGESLPLPEGFDLAQAYPLIKRHQIEAMAYDGAVRCGISADLPIMQQLFGRYCRILLCSEKQMAAIEALCKAFDAHGIDYMPLKGCNLKKLYPKPELRQMGDADILIREEQYDRIEPILLEQGFLSKGQTEYEIKWYKEPLLVELHRGVMPDYNIDYYQYYGNGWQLAKKENGTAYQMSHEDEFVFILCHLAKHYRDGGIGCRQMIDLWIISRIYSGMDKVYVEGQLKKLYLDEFFNNIKKAIAVWFSDEQEDEKTDHITEFIFNSGSWGRRETHIASAGIRNASLTGSIQRGRRLKISRIIFPRLEEMIKLYPVLERKHFLLPLCWGIRIISVLFFHKEKIKNKVNDVELSSTARVTKFHEELRYVGLDFKFKSDRLM